MGSDVINIGGVWLRTMNGRAQVLVEIEGVWRMAIDDLVAERDGRLIPISHLVEPAGVARCPVDPLTGPALPARPQSSVVDDLMEALWECCDSVGLTEGRIRALVDGHLSELFRSGKALDHALSSLLAVRTGLTDEFLTELQRKLREAFKITR